MYKINKTIKSKYKAFSLVEVLLSILIVSIILVLSVPMLTKKNDLKEEKIKGGSIGFYYTKANNTAFPCYVTTLKSDGSKTIVKDTSGKCEAYEFTVPLNVHKIDLTLVAGGGGGGGAAGGTVYEKELEFSSSGTLPSLSLLHSRLKKIVINSLVTSGDAGQERDETTSAAATIKAGTGGNSGLGIMEYEVPSDYVKLDYASDFASENVDTNKLNVSFINETYLTQLAEIQGEKCTEKTPILKICKKWEPFSIYNVKGETGVGVAFESVGKTAMESGDTWAQLTGSDSEDLSQRAAIYLSKKTDSGNDYIQCFTTDLTRKEDNVGGKYQLKEDSNAAHVFDNEGKTIGTDVFSSSCKLTNKSFAPSVSGYTSSINDSSTSFPNGYTVYGGAGGRLAAFGNYGAGGKGEDAVLMCNANNTSCKLPNNTTAAQPNNAGVVRIKSLNNQESTGNAYGKLTAYIDNPGGVGAGGTGGTAIKINDFSVVPGAKYTIVVGKGGTGGTAGKEGTIKNGTYKVHPTTGGNGTGGSCTAIYDENGNLVLMVAGGAGGFGGKINAAAESFPSGNDFATSYPLPDAPTGTLSVPLVFLGQNVTLADLNFDSSVLSGVATPDSAFIDVAENLTYRQPVYSYFTNTMSPVFELGTNSANVASATAISRNSTNQKRFGGFSNYLRTNTGTGTLVSTSGKYNASESTKTIYNGLFFRNSINGAFSYAGGLGGFSGLGTKAGCGGLFVGNRDDNKTDESNQYEFLVNTNSTNRIYKVNEYYDGCSISTSDGHSAKFIAPSSTPGVGETLGAAGAGGGGGGWNLTYGAGKGGDGQNGYVFIKWTAE